MPFLSARPVVPVRSLPENSRDAQKMLSFSINMSHYRSGRTCLFYAYSTLHVKASSRNCTSLEHAATLCGGTTASLMRPTPQPHSRARWLFSQTKKGFPLPPPLQILISGPTVGLLHVLDKHQPDHTQLHRPCPLLLHCATYKYLNSFLYVDTLTTFLPFLFANHRI